MNFNKQKQAIKTLNLQLNHLLKTESLSIEILKQLEKTKLKYVEIQLHQKENNVYDVKIVSSKIKEENSKRENLIIMVEKDLNNLKEMIKRQKGFISSITLTTKSN